MGCSASKKAGDDVVETGDVKINRINDGNKTEAAAKAREEADAKAKAQAEADAKAKAQAEVKAKAEAEALAEASAKKVQAIVRGNADRVKVELMKHACGHYRLNTQADTFGECMCGWPKGAHSAEAFTKKAAKPEVKKVGSVELREKMTRKEYCRCERYAVNLASANFGECQCGEPKARHSPEALASEAAKATRVDSEEARAKMVQKEYAECTEYQVLMGDNSVAFGTCVCGRPRAEHSEAALQAGAEKAGKAKRQESGEVRAGFEKTAAWEDRQTVDCPKYILDMDPNAPFGQCMCGQPKALHSDAAIGLTCAPAVAPAAK